MSLSRDTSRARALLPRIKDHCQALSRRGKHLRFAQWVDCYQDLREIAYGAIWFRSTAKSWYQNHVDALR